MSFMMIFGIFALSAYGLQIVFSLKQIKHFNQIYRQLRRKGKVAIGRRSGKVKAGTIIMFAVDNQGLVIDCWKMQGISVIAKFKQLLEFVGEDIHYLDKFNPIVYQQNKLLIQAIEDAREIYLRVEAGNYVEEKPMSPLSGLVLQAKISKMNLQNKLRGSVK